MVAGETFQRLLQPVPGSILPPCAKHLSSRLKRNGRTVPMTTGQRNDCNCY